MKILVVEDSPTLRHAMCGYIRAENHTPIIAKSGEEALQIVDKRRIDMVIMDVEMPGLDGFEATRLIREGHNEHWIPIIFVTGKSEDESLQEGIEAGGDDYLIKPVSQVILNAKIRAMSRIIAMRDEMDKLNRTLTELSQRDDLTKLFNRRTFEEKAKDYWRTATRRKEPFTIFLLDIDHFKQFNDFYGHPAGDECIRIVADTMKNCLSRPDDLIARYGGEEFIILLPNTSEEGATHVGEHLRQSIESINIPHKSSASSDRVTVSIGGCVMNYTTGSSYERQIDLADRALYEAKESGRNKVSIRLFRPHSTVLVVDDDELSAELMSTHLEGHCSVVCIKSGEECLRLAEDLLPDLILLDVYLEGVNGYEVCSALRANEKTQGIPIILISHCDSQELKRIGQMVNASACLQKPINSNQLIAKLNHFLM